MDLCFVWLFGGGGGETGSVVNNKFGLFLPNPKAQNLKDLDITGDLNLLAP